MAAWAEDPPTHPHRLICVKNARRVSAWNSTRASLMASLAHGAHGLQHHQQQRQHAIHVLFLEPSERDPLMNRLTSALGARVHGRGFCHVEICVPHVPSASSSASAAAQALLPHARQQGQAHGPAYVSSSIYNGETVTATGVKTFANPGYTVHTEVVTEDQLREISNGISEAVRMQIGFDHVGMFMAALPFRVAMPTWGHRKTFCSRSTKKGARDCQPRRISFGCSSVTAGCDIGRYVTELLQMAGVGGDAVSSLDPRVTTPSKLYSVLSRRPQPSTASQGACASDERGVGVIGTVPFKQSSMLSSDNFFWGTNPPPPAATVAASAGARRSPQGGGYRPVGGGGDEWWDD